MKRTSTVLCPVIVGRDDILELFDDLIGEVGQGHGRTVFLSGSAGLGKSRLIRAVARKAMAAGFRVTGGSVSPQDLEVPLGSIREMANSLRNNSEFGTLSQDLLANAGLPNADALGARRTIIRGIADRILAEIDRPTICLFDDLQWTDELSLEVIGELARLGTDRPMLLLADYRHDEFPSATIHREWRARVLSQRHAQEIRLQPLTLDQTAIATTLILGSELPAPREVVTAVFERTNGIPLHIEELLAALDDEDRTDGRRIRDARVPDTIGDAVLARMAHLSNEARLVARAGAVLGRCFTPDVLAGMVNRPLAELEPTLEELVDASILHPYDYVDQGYYDFRHQLLRDAVYGSVPPSQLRRFHAQAAEFGMSLEGASVIHASRHYERAGLRAQAFRAALAAAEGASRISARQEAYELYRRAVENMPDDLPIAEQAELFERYADAAGAIERNEDCVDAARRARELYLSAGRTLDAAGLLLTLGIQGGRGGGSIDDQLAEFARAEAEVAAEPPSREREHLRAIIHGVRALRLVDAWRLDEALIEAAEAHRLGLAINAEETVLEAGLTIARIEVGRGRFQTGLREGLRIVRGARDGGHEGVGVTGYQRLATLATRVHDHQTARLAIREGLRYADAIEQSHCRQIMATTSAFLAWTSGEWDAANELARQEVVDRGCRLGSLGALDVLGLVALGRGRFDDARRWFQESLKAGRQAGEPGLILSPLWGLAELELVADRGAAAVEHCEEALALATRVGERPLFTSFVTTGVRARLASHRPDEAARWLARTETHLEGWEELAGAGLDHARGLILLASGSLTAARESLEAAARGWSAKERTWERLWARLDLAQCLIRSNRHADAAAILGEVRVTAEGLRAEPILARADELARAGRGRGVEDEPWRPLTVREFEVARLIAEGLTNGEIADRLEIAPKTASSHVEHILAKLGVTRRTEVATWVATLATASSPDETRPNNGRPGSLLTANRG